MLHVFQPIKRLALFRTVTCFFCCYRLPLLNVNYSTPVLCGVLLGLLMPTSWNVYSGSLPFFTIVFLFSKPIIDSYVTAVQYLKLHNLPYVTGGITFTHHFLFVYLIIQFWT